VTAAVYQCTAQSIAQTSPHLLAHLPLCAITTAPKVPCPLLLPVSCQPLLLWLAVMRDTHMGRTIDTPPDEDVTACKQQQQQHELMRIVCCKVLLILPWFAQDCLRISRTFRRCSACTRARAADDDDDDAHPKCHVLLRTLQLIYSFTTAMLLQLLLLLLFPPLLLLLRTACAMCCASCRMPTLRCCVAAAAVVVAAPGMCHVLCQLPHAYSTLTRCGCNGNCCCCCGSCFSHCCCCCCAPHVLCAVPRAATDTATLLYC
jgi:hypothetical protein